MERLSEASAVTALDSLETFPRGASLQKGLTGRLGTFDIVFAVLAYNAPLTVVTGYIPLIVGSGNGLGAPFAFLFAGILISLFAVGFTAMSKHSPNPGAFYAYITVGLGRPMGLGSAFMALSAYFFLTLSIYCYSGVVYLGFFKSVFNIDFLPWWAWSFIVMTAVGIFGYLKITLSAKLLSTALLLEIIFVFLWEGGIFITNGPSNTSISWMSMSHFGNGAVGVAILLAVSSFAGVEATAVFREEAKDPEKTVPRATYLAVAILALMFFSATVFYIIAYGPEQALAVSSADPSNATLNSIHHFLGKVGGDIVNILLCSSIFACLLAMQNILARYIYSLGTDGVFPSALAAVHPKHGSPYRASLLVSLCSATVVFVCVCFGIDPFKGYGGLGGVGGYALMLLQLLTSISVVVYFRRKKHTYGLWKTLFAPALASLGLFGTSYLATTNMEFLTGNESLAYTLMALVFSLLVGGILYAQILKTRNNKVYLKIGRQSI